MNIQRNKKRNWVEYLTLGIAIVLSIVSYLWSLKNGYATIYNDAMSHLNISRLVIDNIQPGLAQIGSVWLPLNHILNLTLIWNDWAWHSGFAGSIFSMIAYVISVWGIYKIVFIVTENKWAGFVGAMVFALNPNMLYLQTTPLTESLYLSFFVLSVLLFLKWIKTNGLNYLIALGFLGFLQVLIRYDGWFVSGVEGVGVLVVLVFIQKNKMKDAIGKFIIFALPIIFGVGLWLLWNLLIYGNYLYFMLGDNSAHAQQELIGNISKLITKHNWMISFKAYYYAVVDNIGNYLLVILPIGILTFFIKKNTNLKLLEKILLAIILFSPFVFNEIALYLGFSVINMPELHWAMPLREASNWFNVRYGIIMLPFFSFFVGILACLYEKIKIIPFVIIVLVIFQNFLLFNFNQIILAEGVFDNKVSNISNAANILEARVNKNDKILVSVAVFSSFLFESNLPLSQFIHEGVDKQWNNALKNPQDFAKWIIAREGYSGDPVYRELMKNSNNNFSRYYKSAYKFKDISIYKLKDQNEIFIFIKNKKFLVSVNESFKIKGVNFYDLAYKSEKDIDETFKELSKIGINTIRFWAFGDGFNDGFQTEAGIMNEERLKKMDRIIFDAEKYGVRLIPVLVNNWDDYGGKKQYLEWTGNDIKNGDLFFSENNPKKLFKNYIDHIISRKNTITGRAYSDEPAILSWELMNEPRVLSDKQSILLEWTKEMADYIKQSDRNHLVSIGNEEEVEKINSNENKPTKLCSIENIDICSTHLYLFHENKANYKNFNQLNQFLEAQVEFSQKENKPILLGEFGVSKKTKPFNEKPLKIAKEIVEATNGLNYSGCLIWNWNSVPDDSFGFSMDGFSDGQYSIKDLEEIIND